MCKRRREAGGGREQKKRAGGQWHCTRKRGSERVSPIKRGCGCICSTYSQQILIYGRVIKLVLNLSTAPPYNYSHRACVKRASDLACMYEKRYKCMWMCESKDMFPGESAATALTYGAVEINYEKQQVTCFTCSMLDAKANIKAKKKKKASRS